MCPLCSLPLDLTLLSNLGALLIHPGSSLQTPKITTLILYYRVGLMTFSLTLQLLTVACVILFDEINFTPDGFYLLPCKSFQHKVCKTSLSYFTHLITKNQTQSSFDVEAWIWWPMTMENMGCNQVPMKLRWSLMRPLDDSAWYDYSLLSSYHHVLFSQILEFW